MPWKTGKQTSKGWQILKKEGTRWKVVGHSDTKQDAQSSIRARRAAEYGDKR
jgi:hypothetical protein